MWFLYYYIISSIIACVVMFIYCLAITNKIKRENPNLNLEEKSSISEVIMYLLPLLVPIFNNLFTLFLIFFGNSLYEDILEKVKEMNNPNIKLKNNSIVDNFVLEEYSEKIHKE